MIQFGYLFSDKLAIIGYTAFLNTFEELIKKMSNNERAKFLTGNVYEFLAPEEEDRKMLQEYVEIQKLVNGFKHLPTDLHRAKIIVERKLAVLFEALINLSALNEKVTIFTYFKPLVESGKVQAFRVSGTEKHSLKGSLDFKKLVLHELPFEFNKNSIWFVNELYFSDYFFMERPEGDEDNEEDEDETEEIQGNNPIYFEPLFPFPNLRNIGLLELEAMKMGMEDSWSDIKQLLTEWAEKCYAGEDGYSFLQEERSKEIIITAREKLKENLIFKHFLKTGEDEIKYRIYLTELSPYNFIKYFAAFSEPNAKEIIESVDFPSMNFSVPVFFLWPNDKEMELIKLGMDEIVTELNEMDDANMAAPIKSEAQKTEEPILRPMRKKLIIDEEDDR